MNDWILDRLRELDRRVAELERKLERQEVPLRSRPLPADWEPRIEDVVWAKEKYSDVDETTERQNFRDYYGSRDDVRRDWHAAYRNWISKARQFSKTGASVLPGRSDPRTTSIDQANRERRDRFASKLAALWRDGT